MPYASDYTGNVETILVVHSFGEWPTYHKAYKTDRAIMSMHLHKFVTESTNKHTTNIFLILSYHCIRSQSIQNLLEPGAATRPAQVWTHSQTCHTHSHTQHTHTTHSHTYPYTKSLMYTPLEHNYHKRICTGQHYSKVRVSTSWLTCTQTPC